MHQRTRDTYSKSAASLSEHYDEIGPREGDIDLALALAGNPENAVVLELGCGNGRDARAIMQRTPHYTGIDTCREMIELAGKRAPYGRFEQADVLNFNYAGPYDVVFAFATLRHLNPDEVTSVLKHVHHSLRPGGILYISSNHADTYRTDARKDKYGVREIHYYNPSLLQKRTPAGLKKVKEIYDMVDGQEWFEVAFQKQ